MSLKRFRVAQADSASGMENALSELRAGQKVSHWIWYVFPQIRGLGYSPTAQFYALEDVDEARRYLEDPVLRDHLLLAFGAVAQQLAQGIGVETLMGGRTDALKLISSATLFRQIAKDSAAEETDSLSARCDDVLEAAAREGFSPCPHTLALL